MAWQFRNDIPIYTQLIAQIQQRIVSGALLPGERLPSGAGPGRGGRGKPQHHAAGACMEMEREAAGVTASAPRAGLSPRTGSVIQAT